MLSPAAESALLTRSFKISEKSVNRYGNKRIRQSLLRKLAKCVIAQHGSYTIFQNLKERCQGNMLSRHVNVLVLIDTHDKARDSRMTELAPWLMAMPVRVRWRDW